MILKGSQRGGGMQLARHLMNAHDNDHVELHDLRGFVADDLGGAFKESHAVSLGTRCTQFLFSLSLNPPELENVPVDVFEKAIDAIEQKLNLTDQPRAIIFHEKAGRRHAHCVWSRIDANRMRAINLPHFKVKLQDISRQIYLDNDWQMPAGLQDHGLNDPLNYEQPEGQQAKRTKIDPQVLKAMFQKCWETSDSRAAFANALKEKGFYLAKGDRRGFVAVDRHGEVYSISRWVEVKAKEVRARLGDCKELPSIEEALGFITASLSDDIEIQESSTKLNVEYERRIQEIEQKRIALVSEQRLVRDELRRTHQERFIKEVKNRQVTLPTGLKAAWLKLSGQYQKHLKDNEEQAQLAKERDETEWQQLVELQLRQRRALQQELHQLNFQHEINVKTQWRDTGEALHQVDNDLDSAEILPTLDPNQPLILQDEQEKLSIAAKVRQSPDYILDVISDKKEIFTRNDILRGLANYIEEPTTLRLAIDYVFRSKELVEIQSTPSLRYTTREMQKLKTTLVAHVSAMDSNTKFGISSRTINSAIAHQNKVIQKSVGASLSAEQENAIHHVLGSKQLCSVIGYAGSGKSTMLSAARIAWEKKGINVIGAALSGKAADGLEKSSGIECRTLASLEYSWKQGYNQLQAGDVLVIDEAGMVATKQLVRIIGQAKQRGAKLVLVGDPEQLQPIQAGTPFKDITEQIEVARLTEIRRQNENWQCVASCDLAQQNTGKALMAYEEHGFVKSVNSHSKAIVSLVQDYMSDVELHGANSSRLALAHRRKDVHMINQTIRAARKSSGDLVEEKLFKTVHGARAFAVGDRILFTRNDRELGLRNGMLGAVEIVGEDQLTICLDGDDKDKSRITISPEIYDAFDHGYATTIHKSQGATIDRAFILGSITMDRHLTYVAMTRHREDAHLYLEEEVKRKMYRSETLEVEQARTKIKRSTGPTRT